ncbi:nucleotidyltransferase domain-containing protein [Spirosoma sp.]|uniref:nucleotidyltransferase domain-containing protein n=1 Tax=Spirosoma sp. TaxID=1899569 RepID=UPI003B3AD434
MKYGLSAEVLHAIQTVFARNPSVERVILYGSRALGTYHNGSDIDLAVTGTQLTFQKLLALQIDLENLELLYRFDVLNLKTISNPDLLDHIQRVGILIYQAPQSIVA